MRDFGSAIASKSMGRLGKFANPAGRKGSTMAANM